jgi:hypothetical protein
VGRGQRLPGPVDDRIYRSGRQLDPEQLPGELGRVPAGDAVADRERHRRCLQPRSERRPWHLAGKLGPGRGGTLGAADGVQPMFGHAHRGRRQLGDLVPRWPTSINALRIAEDVLARATPLRPVVDDRVHPLGRKQLPSCPGWPPGLGPLAGFFGRGGAEGGSCEGGNDEFRELRLSRRSSSATRASSRWFASTSSPSRVNSATAVSRSPSRIASASARSTPRSSTHSGVSFSGRPAPSGTTKSDR